jgi:hypothetical protein
MCEEDEQFCYEQLDFCKCSKKHARIDCLSPASWGQLDSSQCHNHSYTAGSIEQDFSTWDELVGLSVTGFGCSQPKLLPSSVIYCHIWDIWDRWGWMELEPSL